MYGTGVHYSESNASGWERTISPIRCDCKGRFRCLAPFPILSRGLFFRYFIHCITCSKYKVTLFRVAQCPSWLSSPRPLVERQSTNTNDLVLILNLDFKKQRHIVACACDTRTSGDVRNAKVGHSWHSAVVALYIKRELGSFVSTFRSH